MAKTRVQQPEVAALDNRFPDCVDLKLVARRDHDSALQLGIDVNFAEAWQDIETTRFHFLKKHWRFRFGVHEGELVFYLQNLRSPIEKRHYASKLPVDKTLQRAETRGNIESDTEGSSVSAGVEVSGKGPKVSSKATASESHKAEKKTGITNQYDLKQVQLHTKGSVTEPKWGFRLQTQEGVLVGRLAAPLAVFDVLEAPYQLTARFLTSFGAIQVTDVDSSEFESLSAKKKAILLITMRKFIYTEAQRYLSAVEIRGQ